jgi:hypothetical protein
LSIFSIYLEVSLLLCNLQTSAINGNLQLQMLTFAIVVIKQCCLQCEERGSSPAASCSTLLSTVPLDPIRAVLTPNKAVIESIQ